MNSLQISDPVLFRIGTTEYFIDLRILEASLEILKKFLIIFWEIQIPYEITHGLFKKSMVKLSINCAGVFRVYAINASLRTEIRGDFNIHGTKYFQDAVFHQKFKNYDVVSLPVPLVVQKTHPLHEIQTWLVITENAF